MADQIDARHIISRNIRVSSEFRPCFQMSTTKVLGIGGTKKLLKSIMTRLFLFSCFLVLASPQLFAAGPASALQTQKEKESYSIGYEVGRSMKTDGVEVDFNILTQGLEDAINQKEPRLKDEEMRKLIVDLRKKAREAQLRKIQEQIVKNAQESETVPRGEQEEGGRQGHRKRPPVPGAEGGRRNHSRTGRLRQGQLPGHVHRRQGIRQLLRERRAGKGPGRWRHQGLDRGIADDEGGLQVAALRAPGACLRKRRARSANPAEQGACVRHGTARGREGGQGRTANAGAGTPSAEDEHHGGNRENRNTATSSGARRAAC